MKLKKTFEDKAVDTFVMVSLFIICIATLYPLIYVFSSSVSSGEAVVANKVRLFPIGFQLSSYRKIFEYKVIWTSYYNTLWYVSVGVTINLFMTFTAAFALSRKDFFARSFFMLFILITMLFSGGLIPLFIVVNDLGLYNTRWAIVLPSAVSAWNLVITRVFFQKNISDSLIEAAKIDGYNDIHILIRVVLPLSKTIIAIIALFCAVGYWNAFFAALIFLADSKLKPLQIVLREILILQDQDVVGGDIKNEYDRMIFFTQIKFVSIVISILPMMALYPFLQKYFVKGIMIGSIKE